MVKVYDKKGVEREIVHSVDAREWVATGEFSYNKPEVKKTRSKVPKA